MQACTIFCWRVRLIILCGSLGTTATR
jgi:hypothetical protein